MPTSPGAARRRPVGGSLPYRPALDGVRALAVTAVLLHHAGVPGVPAGYVGVDVFFVLSGYLVTSLLLAELATTGTVRLGAFWLRRARRLVPALCAVTVVVGLSAPWWLDDTARGRLTGDGVAALFHVANWRAVVSGSDYFTAYATPSPFLHTWSLSVEEQFYLVAPLLVVAAARWGRRHPSARSRLAALVLVVAAVASAGWTMALGAGGASDRAYYGTDTRAQQLLVGVLLAVLAGRPGEHPRAGRHPAGAVVEVAGWGCLVGLAVLVVTVSDPAAWLASGGLAVTAVLSAGLVLSAGRSAPGPLTRVLSARPLVGLGVVSYGVYLWHWPVFLLLDPARTGLDGDVAERVLLAAVRCSVTVLLAVASWHWLERPLRRPATGRRDPVLAALTLPAGLTAALSALVLVPAVVPVPARPANAVVAAPSVPSPSTVPTARPGPSVTPTASGTAVPGPTAPTSPEGPERFFLLGDSTAWNLHAQFPPDPARALVSGATLLGCDPLGGDLVAGGVRLAAPESCRGWPRAWHRALDAARPDVGVLVLGNGLLFDRVLDGRTVRFGTPAYERMLGSWLDETVGRLAAGSGRVYVIDLPCFAKRDSGLDATAAVVNDTGRQERVNALVRARLASRPDVRVLALRAAVCPGGAVRRRRRRRPRPPGRGPLVRTRGTDGLEMAARRCGPPAGRTPRVRRPRAGNGAAADERCRLGLAVVPPSRWRLRPAARR